MVFRAFSLGFSWATLDCPWLGSPQAQLKSKLCLHSIRWSSRNVLIPGRSLTLLPNFGADHFWDWIFEMSSVTLGSQIQIRSVGIPNYEPQGTSFWRKISRLFLFRPLLLSRAKIDTSGGPSSTVFHFLIWQHPWWNLERKLQFKKTYENTTFLHQANKSLRQKV